MNILQLAQLLGNIRFGEVDGGNELINIITELLPESIHLDTNNSGLDFIAIYDDLPIENKKQLTAISLSTRQDLMVEILNDVVYINTQKQRIKEREDKARNMQYILMIVVITFISTYLSYQYHVNATHVYGGGYDSMFMDFVNKVSELIKEDTVE